jgi:hypothetical protein
MTIPTPVAQRQSSSLELAKPNIAGVMYRNLFHVIINKLGRDGFNWEGARVYIHESMGYSGNAKRFKRMPDKVCSLEIRFSNRISFQS